jgi:hypothetical protein
MMTLAYFFVVPTQIFRLEKLTKSITLSNQCLTVADEQNYNISGKNCTSSLNMHWIFTEKRIENRNKFYLMNVMTLQCFEFLDRKSNDMNQNTGEVALKQCNKTDGQYIVVDENGKAIRGGPRRYYLRLEMKAGDVGYAAFSERNKLDRWSNSMKDTPRLDNRPITTYTGQCSMYSKENKHIQDVPEKCRFLHS